MSWGLCSWLLAWCLLVTVVGTAVVPVCWCCVFVTTGKSFAVTEINLLNLKYEILWLVSCYYLLYLVWDFMICNLYFIRVTYLATPCPFVAVTLTIAFRPPAPCKFKLCTSNMVLPLDELLEFEWPCPDSGLDGGVRIWPSPSHPLSSSSSISWNTFNNHKFYNWNVKNVFLLLLLLKN